MFTTKKSIFSFIFNFLAIKVFATALLMTAINFSKEPHVMAPQQPSASSRHSYVTYEPRDIYTCNIKALYESKTTMSTCKSNKLFIS